MVRPLNLRPPISPRFTFECPSCGTRLGINTRQRNALIRCVHCRIELPGPDFRLGRLDESEPRPVLPYRCACPQCQAQNDVTTAEIGSLLRCTSCEEWFRQSPPSWERWRRVVARVFTASDQRRSLHHMMFAGSRIAWDDAELDSRAVRRFEFYCGGCGRLQRSRVWDIASQQRCPDCRALYIVPSPPHAPLVERVERVALWQDVRRAGVYCPGCGQVVPDGDATRERQSFCRGCAVWF